MLQSAGQGVFLVERFLLHMRVEVIKKFALDGIQGVNIAGQWHYCTEGTFAIDEDDLLHFNCAGGYLVIVDAEKIDALSIGGTCKSLMPY